MNGDIQNFFQGMVLQDLPPTTVQNLDTVSGMCSKHTTIGSDGFHPRVLGQLSKATKRVIAALLNATEKVESWVGVINVLNAVLKKTGGSRLLGLFNTRYRWWSRIRFLTVAEWEEKHPHRVFWSGKGKPSTRLIMEFLLQDELVRAEGMYGAAHIRDLWKAYEVVKWEALVKEAKAMHFPLKLLKMALSGYATPRRVKLAGSLSEELRVTQSITAGCSCAKAFLMVLCYRAMVRVGAYSPSSVTLRVFVDDSGIQWTGIYLDGVSELQEAMDAWQEGVDEVELFNAVEKEALLVSHPGLLQKLRGF